MCLRLAKGCFCNGSKIEKDFEKMKWQVKIHEKMPFDSRTKELTFFLLLGVPLCTLALQNAAFGRQTKSKESLKK